ncbi:TPA: site-specific integrase [Serratia fonticola]
MAVIQLLDTTGIRLNQLLHIRLMDVKLDDGIIELESNGCKNHNEHRVPIIEELRPWLVRVLDESRQRHVLPDAQLFNVGRFVPRLRKKYPDKMTEAPLRSFFRRLSKMMNYTATPHRFRHTVPAISDACEFFQDTMSMFAEMQPLYQMLGLLTGGHAGNLDCVQQRGLKRFTVDVDIDNVAAILSRDYSDVMHDAIEWMRQQFTRSANQRCCIVTSLACRRSGRLSHQNNPPQREALSVFYRRNTHGGYYCPYTDAGVTGGQRQSIQCVARQGSWSLCHV